MFQNIGEKIKMLAKVVCWVGIVGCVIGGIVLCAVGADSDEGGLMIGLGITLMILGPLVSWVGCFVLYGYGDLISRVRSIEEKLCGKAGGAEDKDAHEHEKEHEIDERLAKLESLKNQNLISEEEYRDAVGKLQ